MTFPEFEKQYTELAEAFGVQNFNMKRGALLFKFVADMNASWWRYTVEQMIITNNPKFNIAEGANAERKAMNSAKRAEEESKAAENLLRNASRDDSERARELFNMFKKDNKGA